MRRRQPPAPPGTVRLYGKCTGPGPWHLMTSAMAPGALCGRRAHYHGRDNGDDRICPGCITVEQRQHRERTAG